MTVAEIRPKIMGQHEAVVQRRSPAHELLAIWLFPEHRDQRAQQQLLREAHARVRRHFERAELDQAEPAGRAVRRIELIDADFGAMRVARDIDQQVAEEAIDQPWRDVPNVRDREPAKARSRVRRALRGGLRRRAAPGSSVR